MVAAGGFALAGFLGTSGPDVLVIVAIEVVAILFGTASLIRRTRREMASIRSEVNVQLPQDEVPSESAISTAARLLSLADAELAAGLIIDPQSYFRRITESASPAPGHITVKATYSLELPHASQEVRIPLSFVRRGELLNFLTITDADSKTIGMLPYEEESLYLASVMRKLVIGAMTRRNLERYTSEVELDVTTLLARRTPASEQQTSLIEHKLISLEPNSRRPDLIVAALLMIRELRERTPLLVAMPPQAVNAAGSNIRLRFATERRLALKQAIDDRARGLGWALDLLGRLALGVHPNSIVVPLENADRASNYHVQVTAPSEHLYLGEQSGIDDDRVAREPRRGQPFSHAFVRHGVGYFGLLWRSRFFEVPPGSTGTAAVAAFAVLFGCVLLAWTQLHWSNALGSGSASLLFALPGVATAFFGFSQSSGFLRRSIRARASSIASLLIALFAVFFATTHTRSAKYHSGLMATDIAHLSPALVPWLVLIGFQAIHTVYVTSIFAQRTFVYWFARIQ